MNEAIIETHEVKKRYRMAGEELWALKGISMQVRRGEFLSIMGPSGSGKSTLFNQLGALDQPTEGTVIFEGHSIFELGEPQQAWFRCNRIGYIFQTYNLVPVMSAVQNVALPLLFQGRERVEAEARAVEVLKQVGLGHRLDHKPFELSGGQQQRVAIARALANRPAVILADEPTGNLDSKTGEEVISLLRDLNRQEGVTVICSTHDPKMLKASDRILWIVDGLIRKEMLPSEVRLEEEGSAIPASVNPAYAPEHEGP